MTFGSRTFFGATLLALVLFACSVDAHGWLSNPLPRGQYLTPKKQAYQEYTPTVGNTPNSQEFVCRNDPAAPQASWIPLTAGTSQAITLQFNAIHPGDCFVYLTYDGDKTESEMEWFKIWEQHECYKLTNYSIPIPSYLPSGSHVIFRWEWYALHAFPTVEYYCQCVDAVMTGSATGALPQPQVNMPGHLPILTGDYADGNNNYWWPYDDQPMFFTGPPVATLNGVTTTPTTKPTSAATTAPTSAPTTKPTSAATTAPTSKPTSAATTAPTSKPTSAATTAPTTAPTTKPTTPATQAPTTKPTSAATTAPTSAPSAGNIKVGLNGGSSSWWLGVIVSGGAETTVKVELSDSGSLSSWVALSDQSYAYVYEATAQLQAPLSLRLTSSSGKQVVLTNVFTTFSTNGQLVDSGKAYSGSTSTSAPTTPATQAPTTKPTTPATQAPTTKPTSPATQAPTSKPTTPATQAPTTKPTTPPATQVPTGPANSGVAVLDGSSVWWFAFSISGYSANQFSKVEVKDSGAYTTFAQASNEWADVFVFSPTSPALVLPITVKATLTSGTALTFTVSSL